MHEQRYTRIKYTYKVAHLQNIKTFGRGPEYPIMETPLWSCQNICEALTYILDNTFIRFGTKLYRQIAGIQMGISCVPLIADFYLCFFFL